MAELHADPLQPAQPASRSSLSRACGGWLALAALLAFLVDLWMMIYWIYTVNS